MADPVVHRHHFNFTPSENSGEGLSLETLYLHNGDPNGIYTNQKLTLQSYCNDATFNLYGAALDPSILRKLADELVAAEAAALLKLNNVEK